MLSVTCDRYSELVLFVVGKFTHGVINNIENNSSYDNSNNDNNNNNNNNNNIF